MTKCPKCGTSNPAGSRFCNACGEPLPSGGVRCPMCDAINPKGSVFCHSCNARLVPMSGAPEEGIEHEQETAPAEGSETEQEPGSIDWLDELREAAEHEPEIVEYEDSETYEEPLAPADIPDWLSEMGPIGEETPADAGLAERESDEDRGRADTVYTEAEPTTSPDEKAVEPFLPGQAPRPEPADIPDWIQDRGPAPPSDAATGHDERAMEEREVGPEELYRALERPQAKEPDLNEAPDWMRDVVGGSTQVDGGELKRESKQARDVELSDEEPVLIEIPEWLKEGQPDRPTAPPVIPEREERSVPEKPSGEEPQPPVETGPKVPPEEAEIPAWLQEPQDRTGEPLPEEEPELLAETLGEQVETPEWLTELVSPTGTQEEEPPLLAEEPIAPEEGPERADIPTWLQQFRPGRSEGDETAEAPVETEGPLEGLRHLIPSSSILSPIRTPDAPLEGGSARPSLVRADLLQRLIDQPTLASKEKAQPKRTRAGSQVERWIVALMLVGVVVAALVRPIVAGPGDAPDAGSALEAGDRVLAVFDYGPPEAAEVGTAAEPVIRHILDEGATLSIVSTRPDGPLVAEAMMREVNASEGQFTFIGYRPGAAMAASHLLDTTEGDPSLLLLLSGQPMPLLLWIEQATASYEGRVPAVLVGSAVLEPIASPYAGADAGQLSGGIYGLMGGSSYEMLREASGDATRRLDALAAGHMAIIFLMIAGALVYGMRGPQEDGQ